MGVYEILRSAILSKQQIICQYGGHPREMCPHAIGTKNGEPHVLSYQFGGSSNSGLPPEGQWRCMVIANISDASAQDGDWQTGDSHTQPQSCVDVLDVEVEY